MTAKLKGPEIMTESSKFDVMIQQIWSTTREKSELALASSNEQDVHNVKSTKRQYFQKFHFPVGPNSVFLVY
jgi:hypothetical protein